VRRWRVDRLCGFVSAVAAFSKAEADRLGSVVNVIDAMAGDLVTSELPQNAA